MVNLGDCSGLQSSQTKTDDDEATTETVNTPPLTTTEDEVPVIHDSDPVTDVPTDDVEDEVIREAASLGYIGEIRAGFLKVTVHRAENLVSKDFNGKSDPYVVVRKLVRRTSPSMWRRLLVQCSSSALATC